MRMLSAANLVMLALSDGVWLNHEIAITGIIASHMIIKIFSSRVTLPDPAWNAS